MFDHQIAVTGANGFVGRALCDELESRGFTVRRLVRSASSDLKLVPVGDINANTNWVRALEGVSTVLHCAARVHVMSDEGRDALDEYRMVNVEGTRRLAEQAALQGVKRLIFISTVKVNGESTCNVLRSFQAEGAFTPFDPPNPQGPYAVSKWEAEQALWKVCEKNDLDIVIVRLPLVYGPGVRANFLRLIKLVQLGWPLPFGMAKNRRSLVSLDNLVDLLICCVHHPAAVGQTFLVSDGMDLSTKQLVKSLILELNAEILRAARNKKVKIYNPIFFPVPVWLLLMAGRILGRQAEIERLFGTLRVDITHTCKTLGWNPPISINEGLRRTLTK
jgi:nucleoside-diphosphate-sugar epimerase